MTKASQPETVIPHVDDLQATSFDMLEQYVIAHLDDINDEFLKEQADAGQSQSAVQDSK